MPNPLHFCGKPYSFPTDLARYFDRYSAKHVLEEAVAEYDFSETITSSKAELLGIEHQASIKGIIKLAASGVT